jgi:hypothetical protein
MLKATSVPAVCLAAPCAGGRSPGAHFDSLGLVL